MDTFLFSQTHYAKKLDKCQKCDESNAIETYNCLKISNQEIKLFLFCHLTRYFDFSFIRTAAS